MLNKKWSHIQFLGALILIIVISVIFYSNDPVEFLKGLGVTNSYIFTFILAVIAGVVFLTSAFFYATVAGFAITGLSPILLGLVGGLGLFISDIFIFYLGKNGRQSLDLEQHSRIVKFSNWLIKQPYYLVVIFVILYGLTPLPNEVLMLALSVFGYDFKRIWLPIMLADIAIVTAISYLALAGVEVLNF